jgi:hypothetical protein
MRTVPHRPPEAGKTNTALARRSRTRPQFWPVRGGASLVAALLLTLADPRWAAAQSEPPTAPPAYWGPLSIIPEDVRYPQPVS